MAYITDVEKKMNGTEQMGGFASRAYKNLSKFNLFKH